jgi:hypothetical protein
MKKICRPRLAYHVTPADNLTSILADGLQPRVGERASLIGELNPGVYLFPSVEALQDGLSNWLGEHFDDHQLLRVLAVDISGLESTAGAGFEVIVTQSVDSSRIMMILDEDLKPVLAPHASCPAPTPT